METAEAKYAGVWGVGDDKDQKVDQGNSGSSKILFLHQCGADEGSKVLRSHAELPFRKSEKVIGEIAYGNRVRIQSQFLISLMTFSLSLESMFRGNQGIMGFVGKYGNIRVFRIPLQ